MDNIKIKLNSKGVPGIQNNIFLENCIRRISLNITILNMMAIIAPAAENFNNLTVINHTKQNIKVNGHETIQSNPRKDATPLPPLNFNQIGNMWPNIVRKPQIADKSLP